MTSNYHTPIPDGAAADAATFNNPLGEMDAALTEALLAERDGHIIQDEGVDLAQQPRVDFTGAGVAVSNTPGKTVVTIPGGISHSLATAVNDFLVASGAGVFVKKTLAEVKTILGLGTAAFIDVGTTASKVVQLDASAKLPAVDGSQLTGISSSPKNLLINGGFDFWQRINPSTAKAMTDNTYNAPDRWYSLIQGAGATINRNAGIGKSKYAAKIIMGGTTNRVGLAQIIESTNSIPERGNTITKQVLVKPVNNAGSGTRKYRIALIEWTGTADVIGATPHDLVANWASSTFTLGNFFEGTTKTLVGTASFTLTHNTETVISVSGTISNSCNNLIMFVWTEDVPTHASDYVLIGEAGSYRTSTVQNWNPRPMAQEKHLCQRHFVSSYNDDVAPGTSSVATFYVFLAQATNALYGGIQLPVSMFAVPTTTCYSYLGTAGKAGNMGGGDVGTTVTIPAGQNMIAKVSDSGTGFAVGTQYLFSFTAEAEI